MSQTSPPPAAEGQQFRREDIQDIAKRQKGVLVCLLIYILTLVGVALAGEELLLLARIVVGVAGIVAMVFAFMLAIKLYGTATGIVLGLLTLIPLIGLIVLLVINSKATRVLKDNGIDVGLLGAKGPVA